jgi:opacity protein-like surface antigen
VLIGGAPSALAGDLYLAGKLAVSTATGDSGGSTTFGFSPNGSDSDSSPVWGGAVGFEFQLDEPVPSVADWPLLDSSLRVELEGLGGRDYELRTNGADPFFTETTSWTVMQNLWIDVPMQRAVTALFGRVPLLEPVSFYLGAGAGLAINDVETTDNVSRGSDLGLDLAWQGGTGFSYAFTDLVTFSIGYRYQDLGEVEMKLFTNPSQPPVGKFSMQMAAHELQTGLRLRFFSVPLPQLDR